MRVLLDECLPRKLKGNVEGHEVFTVPEMGWAAKRNGELLRLAADRFDVLLTVDRGFGLKEDPAGLSIAIIILAARSNRLTDLLPLLPRLHSQLSDIQPGQLVRLG